LNCMTTVEQSYTWQPVRQLYPRLAILAVGLFVVGTNGFVIAGLLPQIASTLRVTPTAVSYSITIYAVIVAVASPAVAILLARVSRTTLMSLGLVLVAVGIVIAALAPTLAVFTLGRVVAAFGGAALVPPATAAAAALASPERRGRAIAIVAVGFTAALAFGAPLGTAIAAAGSWRDPLFGLAGLAAVTAAAIAVFVRRVPLGAPVSAKQRFAILRDPRILFALIATLLVVSSFNVGYIFSSAITVDATGGSASLLALLLLIFGVAGIAGNMAAGPLTDRFGNRRVAVVVLALLFVSMLVLTLVAHSLVGTAVVFAVWGLAANAIALPIQHRLVQVNPTTAGVALSWYSTALYAGIALAPPLGAAALRLGEATLIPVFAAAVVLLALIVYLLGYVTHGAAPALAPGGASAGS
jgi:MFS transporter, DHA1 family, inner membrane transport protein